MNDLQEGKLRPLLEKVRNDDSLMLAIRSNYINIYYQGGNILRLEEKERDKSYAASFNRKYAQGHEPDWLSLLPDRIRDSSGAAVWNERFADLMKIMDAFFNNHDNPERLLQQEMVCANNQAANGVYLIVDIEFAYPGKYARFDMLGVELLPDRKSYRPVIIELKQGDKALGGSAGLIKHLRDANRLLGERDAKASILQTIGHQLEQLQQLGLLGTGFTNIPLRDDTKSPIFAFVFSEHESKSRKLGNELTSRGFTEQETLAEFDIKYCLLPEGQHLLRKQDMLTKDEFLNLSEVKIPQKYRERE